MTRSEFTKLSREMAGRDGALGAGILIAIVTMLALFLIWASLAELDRVTRGEGKIVSSVQNQLIQAAEPGVILRRYVSENSVVSEGDVLFELDPIDASAELNRVEQRLLALSVREARLKAEIEGAGLQIDPQLAGQVPSVAQSEQSLFSARQAELEGAVAVLEERLARARQDLRGAETRGESLGRTAGYLEEEISVVEPLVRDNIAPTTRLLELQRQLEGVRGEIQQAEVAAGSAASQVTETLTEIENTLANFRLRAMGELNDVVSEQSELGESLPQLQERVERTTIRAPLDGVVSRLNYRTAGGFVNRGDVILELVPTGEDLIIEARIQPQDISSIRLGDAVNIRLSAYDSSKYGTVDGRVVRISPDAVPADSETGASYYLIDVAIESQITLETGEAVTYMPGMTATVDVLSGKQTVLSYFWQPIARTQELALRD